MPAERCANCGSADTGAMLDTFTCHNCGAVTDYGGKLVSGPTVEPGVVAPPVVTVSPATTGDDPTRTVTTKAPGDQFTSTETLGANDPAASTVPPQPLMDSDGQPREPGEGQAVQP